MIFTKTIFHFCAQDQKYEFLRFVSFILLNNYPDFSVKLHEQDKLLSHMLGYIPPWRKGAVFMRVVVVKFPKALCGLMRKIFHMD